MYGSLASEKEPAISPGFSRSKGLQKMVSFLLTTAFTCAGCFCLWEAGLTFSYSWRNLCLSILLSIKICWFPCLTILLILHTHTHSHTHTHTHTHIYIYIHIRADTLIYTCIYTYMLRLNAFILIYIYIYILRSTCICIIAPKYMHLGTEELAVS